MPRCHWRRGYLATNNVYHHSLPCLFHRKFSFIHYLHMLSYILLIDSKFIVFALVFCSVFYSVSLVPCRWQRRGHQTTNDNKCCCFLVVLRYFQCTRQGPDLSGPCLFICSETNLNPRPKFDELVFCYQFLLPNYRHASLSTTNHEWP